MIKLKWIILTYFTMTSSLVYGGPLKHSDEPYHEIHGDGPWHAHSHHKDHAIYELEQKTAHKLYDLEHRKQEEQKRVIDHELAIKHEIENQHNLHQKLAQKHEVEYKLHELDKHRDDIQHRTGSTLHEIERLKYELEIKRRELELHTGYKLHDLEKQKQDLSLKIQEIDKHIGDKLHDIEHKKEEEHKHIIQHSIHDRHELDHHKHGIPTKDYSDLHYKPHDIEHKKEDHEHAIKQHSILDHHELDHHDFPVKHYPDLQHRPDHKHYEIDYHKHSYQGHEQSHSFEQKFNKPLSISPSSSPKPEILSHELYHKRQNEKRRPIPENQNKKPNLEGDSLSLLPGDKQPEKDPLEKNKSGTGSLPDSDRPDQSSVNSESDLNQPSPVSTTEQSSSQFEQGQSGINQPEQNQSEQSSSDTDVNSTDSYSSEQGPGTNPDSVTDPSQTSSELDQSTGRDTAAIALSAIRPDDDSVVKQQSDIAPVVDLRELSDPQQTGSGTNSEAESGLSPTGDSEQRDVNSPNAESSTGLKNPVVLSQGYGPEDGPSNVFNSASEIARGSSVLKSENSGISDFAL